MESLLQVKKPFQVKRKQLIIITEKSWEWGECHGVGHPSSNEGKVRGSDNFLKGTSRISKPLEMGALNSFMQDMVFLLAKVSWLPIPSSASLLSYIFKVTGQV